MENYLKTKEKCIEYCQEMGEDDIDECIGDLKEDYGSDICSLQNEFIKENEILNNPNFIELIKLLIKLLEFLYSIRCENGNNYDSSIITQIGNINIQNYDLTFKKLDNLEFPGDGSIQNSYPSSFGKYLEILKKIKESNGNINYNDCLLKEYSEFVSDYQPWTTMLNTFINVLYDKNENIKKILPNGKIPDIRKLSDYCKKENNFINGSIIKKNKKIFNKLNGNFNILIQNLNTITESKKNKKSRSKTLKRSQSLSTSNKTSKENKKPISKTLRRSQSLSSSKKKVK